MQEDNTFKKTRSALTRKRGGGKRKNRDARRDQRRLEAEARQKIYDALSIDEKVAKATSGSKEMMRLKVQQFKDQGITDANGKRINAT